MREITKSLEELTDSREVLESRPHPFVPIFITVLVLLLTAALTWSYFGEIDNLAKATGVVRPNEKVVTVQAPIYGKVRELTFRQGQHVQEGDVLFTFSQEDVQKDLENRQLELKKLQKEIDLLVKYKDSILQTTNLFTQEDEKSKYYYDLVEQYIVYYQSLQKDIETTKQSYSSKINEVQNSKESIDVNLEENKRNQEKITRDFELEKTNLENDIQKIVLELEGEELLKTSIETNKLALPDSDMKRVTLFNSYQTRLKSLEFNSDNYKATYERSKELGERFVPAAQLAKEKEQYEASLLEIESFKNDNLQTVSQNISNLNSQLQQQKVALEKLNKTADLQSHNEGLIVQKEHLTEQQQDLKEQEGTQIQTGQINLEKFKADKLVEVNMLIEEQNSKKTILSENIDQLKLSQDKGVIKAPTSGSVNILKDINAGEIVQAGENILSIIPDNESKYKMVVAVPNHEIGKIAVGDDVNFHITAFPKQSYGHLTGKITSISSDSVITNEGASFYNVEASIMNKPLVNKKGEQGEVRVGMTAEVFVITESKKVLHYLLEKINLRD